MHKTVARQQNSCCVWGFSVPRSLGCCRPSYRSCYRQTRCRSCWCCHLRCFHAVAVSAWDGNCIYYNNKLSINPRDADCFQCCSPPTQQLSELTAASGSFIRNHQKWNQAEAADWSLRELASMKMSWWHLLNQIIKGAWRPVTCAVCLCRRPLCLASISPHPPSQFCLMRRKYWNEFWPLREHLSCGRGAP